MQTQAFLEKKKWPALSGLVLEQELTLDPYRAFYDVMKYLNPNL